MIPFSRWLTLALLIWGIPSALFVGGIGLYQGLIEQRAIQSTHSEVENRLLEFSQRCDFAVFFEKRCQDLFARLSRNGRSATERQRELTSFTEALPPGLVRCFLFDAGGRLESPATHPFPEGAREFFRMAARPWREHLLISSSLSLKLQQFLANPEGTLRILQGRPGQMLSIGTPEASYGWFQSLFTDPKRPFGGLLILFHERVLPDGYLLRHFAAELSDSKVQIGFRTNRGTTLIPGMLNQNLFQNLLRRFDLVPEDRFQTAGLIGGIQRFDSSTLIVGVTEKPGGSHRLPAALLVGFACGSLLLLRRSYRILVLEEEVHFSLTPKTLFFILLGLGFPLVLSGMLATVFLEEKQETLTQEIRDETIQALRLIDQGFDLFLTRRLQTYRRLSRKLEQQIESPGAIHDTLSRIYARDGIDALYLISSTSYQLGFFRGLPIEIRRILAEPPSIRDQILESAIERQYMPTYGEWIAITKGSFTASKISEYEQLLLRLITHAARSAIDHFNVSRGFDSGQPDSLQQLAMDGMMDDEGRQYIEAVRTQLSGFIPMGSGNDFGLNYMEVIPDKSGRGAYFLILFQNLNVLEHEYLRSFQSVPGRFAEVAAVSLYPTARNFPRFDSFRPFLDLLQRTRKSRTNILFHTTVENGQPQELGVLRCTHLKHYTLIKPIPAPLVAERLWQSKLQVLGLMLGTLLFGLGLFWIFMQRLLVPVREIAEGIEAMGRKAFDFRVPVRTSDELGRLCQALNHALEHLGQMEVASAIQTALLPRSPYITPGAFVAGKNQMTQAVGGDYFDIIPLNDNLCAVILGDVSGHGVSAAMVAGMAKAGFSLLCPHYPDHPEKVLEKLNAHFLRILDRTKMMTCLLGIVHRDSRKMVFSNAGQSYPLLISRNGKSELYKFPSSPLGVRGKARFQSNEIDLTQFDVVFYSDGLIEAQNSRGEMVDYERFAQAAERVFPGSLSQFLERLFAEIRAMTDPEPWPDDSSAVIISSRSLDGETKDSLAGEQGKRS